MGYDPLVLKELKKYSKLPEQQISEKLNQIAQDEYEKWLNNEMNFTRMRDLHIWRFSKFMQNIFDFKTPTDESVSFIFQITLSAARSLIKDYKAVYGRKGYKQNLGEEVAKILEVKLNDLQKTNEDEIEVSFHNNSQIDELFEATRRIASIDSTIAEPQKKPGRTYVFLIEKETAEKVIKELRRY